MLGFEKNSTEETNINIISIAIPVFVATSVPTANIDSGTKNGFIELTATSMLSTILKNLLFVIFLFNKLSI